MNNILSLRNAYFLVYGAFSHLFSFQLRMATSTSTSEIGLHKSATNDTSAVHSSSITKTGDSFFIPLQGLRNSLQQNSALNRPGRRLNPSELSVHFEPWLKEPKLLDQYDVFISYRWSERDTSFTQALYDRFSLFCIGSNDRSIEIFLDTARLEIGRNFRSDFAKSLIHSTVVMPIVTSESLKRMVDYTHDVDVVDNVLVCFRFLLLLRFFSFFVCLFCFFFILPFIYNLCYYC